MLGADTDCPSCNNLIQLPLPQSKAQPVSVSVELSFKCPGCRQALHAPLEMLGAVIDCPNCKQFLQLPGLPPSLLPLQASREPAKSAAAPRVLRKGPPPPKLRLAPRR